MTEFNKVYFSVLTIRVSGGSRVEGNRVDALDIVGVYPSEDEAIEELERITTSSAIDKNQVRYCHGVECEVEYFIDQYEIGAKTKDPEHYHGFDFPPFTKEVLL